MFSALRTDVLSYSHPRFQQKSTSNTDANNHSEQKTTAVYKSKIHTQEPMQALINNHATEPSKRLEVAREIVYHSSSKPRKSRGRYAKHLPEVKKAALVEVYLGTSINQVSKKYGIKY